MSTDTHDRAAVEDRLWKEVEKARFGMLGLVDMDPPQHLQPMTAFADKEGHTIWFFTRADTDIARDSVAGQKAMLVIQSKDQDVQACISGDISVTRDEAVIDRFWNPVVAAWYPQGKDDPQLTLLRFRPDDAQVWLHEAGPVRFAWEIAKANATGTTPDLGDKAHVDLR